MRIKWCCRCGNTARSVLISYVIPILTLCFLVTDTTSRLATNDERLYMNPRELPISQPAQNYSQLIKPSRSLPSTNTSNNSIKQRKQHDYLPTYDIIDLAPIKPDLSNSELFQSMEARNLSANDEQLQQNVLNLRRVMLERRQKLLKKQAIEESISKSKDPSRKNQRNVTLESDINTINLLIDMLLMANKRLMDQQRERLPSESIPTEVKIAKPVTSKAAGLQHSTSPKHGQVQASSSASVATKLEGKKQSNDETATLSPKKRKKQKKLKQHKKSNAPLDHVLVRPGFDHLHKDDKDSTSSDHMNYAGQHPALQLNHPPTLTGHAGEQEDLLRNHRPIVAQDLLHVNRQYPPPYSNDGLYTNDRMFVSQPKLSRQHPFYEYLQRQTPTYGPHQHLDPRQTAEAEEEQARLHGVPPYNGLRMEDWTTQQQPVQPQIVAGSPVVQAHHHITEQDPYGAFKPTASPPLPPVSTGQPENQIQQQNEEPANQPFGLVGHPIHHMLLAAKKQQQDALAYERQRLQHEVELQKRQELMRKQHEELLERQRQQMKNEQEARQKQEQKAKQQQQAEEQAKQQDKQQVDNQQQQEGDQQENEGNNENEHQQQQDEGSEQQQQDQQAEQPKEDDPDMKNFQNFAGDTDFTDLFPPGILSEAEIKEMRRDQAEQRQRQEQEEREKQQQQQEQAEQEEQGGGEQGSDSGQQQDGGSGELAPEQQQQQQQPEQQQVEQTTSNNATQTSNKSTASDTSKETKANRLVSNQQVSQNGTSNKEAGGGSGAGAGAKEQEQPRANKTRRSNLASAESFERQTVQFDDDNEDERLALITDTHAQDYHDRYIKPFMVAADNGGSENSFY